MARAAAALSLLLAVLAAGSLLRSTEFHSYDVKIVKANDGSLQVEKNPYFGKFEIDFPYGTEWKFVNTTEDTVVVQIVENQSGMCHIRFSPAGSIFCESQQIPLAPKATFTLGATADETYYPIAWYPGELRVAKQGQPLVPADPDLEVERDYGTFKILVAVVSTVLAIVLFRKRR